MGKTRFPVKLRSNPFTITQNLLRDRQVRPTPAWIPAFTLFPPSPAPLYSAIPSEIGAFIPESYLESIEKSQSESCTRVSEPRSKYKPRYYTRPFEIVYAEDLMRSEFFKTHPFELDRPFCAVETSHSVVERDWSDIDGGKSLDGIDTEQVPLSGESVIKYAGYLMSDKGGLLTTGEAYREALAAFYKRAAEIEYESAQKKHENNQQFKAKLDAEIEQNQKNGMEVRHSHQPDRPWTEEFMEKESAELDDNEKYISQLATTRTDNSYAVARGNEHRKVSSSVGSRT